MVPRDELSRWKIVFRLRPEFQRGLPWLGFLISTVLHAGVFTALAVAPHFTAREVVVSCPVEVLLEPPRLYAVDVKPMSGAKEEQKALQYLQQAEEEYEVQVTQNRNAGGGGGGAGSIAEDLADLFELEKDKLANQYETASRASEMQAEQKIEVPVEEKPAPASSQSQAVAASAAGESNYWQQVRTAVAGQVRYPNSARINNIEGYALVKLTIDGEGRLCGAEAIECSSKIFGRYATEAVVRAAPFPAPSHAGTPPLSAVIPVHFKVNNKEKEG